MTFKATIIDPPPTGWRLVKKKVRRHARYAALDALSLRQRLLEDTERGLTTPRIHFPYLHTVPHPEEPRLRALLAKLSETSTFISYSEAFRRLRSGQIDKPYIALSFDDGFSSNARTARILEDFGAPGMFFVPPGFIGVKTVKEAREFFGFKEGCYEPALTWSDIEHLKSRGHEIGNHSRFHQVMSWISPQEMVDEISEGAEMLRSRLGEVEHFAWPRGRFHHFTEAAARTVFATGHLSCASAERGAHPQVHRGSLNSLCIRRDHLMTEWPLRHQLYFLARSALRSWSSSLEGERVDSWPQDWDVEGAL